MKLYEIYYQVNTGSELCKDYAIVKAVTNKEALSKLHSYILTTGYENSIWSVYSVKEFTGDVFSGRFRPYKGDY